MHKVFISTPISGFSTKKEYEEYRNTVLELISALRKECLICSEIEKVLGKSDYDTPAKSVEDDFRNIRDNDIFILLHPGRMQTSSLIEFGYACAYKKKIIMVASQKDLPYLAIGYAEYSVDAVIVETEKLSHKDFCRILLEIDKLDK
jgi:hypothetical protein